MINRAAGASGIVPATTTQIVSGLYIEAPPTTSFAAINLISRGFGWRIHCGVEVSLRLLNRVPINNTLAAYVLAFPLPHCRLYYSQVTVEPQKSIDYVQRNRNKKLYIAVLY
jgi:hypothetical protein